MGDIKKALEHAGIKGTGGEGMKKKCQDCGNEFIPKEPHHKVCFDCMRKRRGGTSGFKKPFAKLPSEYLKSGYFDEKGYLRSGIFKEEAKEVANVLAALRMTPTSLRAFYKQIKSY